MIFLLLVCGLDVVRGKSISLHKQLTIEERHFYFGDSTDKEIEKNYVLGSLRKIEKTNNLLRKLVGSETDDNEYMFEAFDINVKLNLKNNDNLVSQRASVVYMGENGEENRKRVNSELLNCQMIHIDENVTAAISSCTEGKFMGFITTPEDTFELTPLTDRLKSMLFLFRNTNVLNIFGGEEEVLVNEHYIVKRATFPNFDSHDSTAFSDWEVEVDDTILDIELFETEMSDTSTPKLIETAIFFDHIAYNKFSSVYSDDEIEELLLSYVNQVQALYQVKSLEQTVDIMIVYLEIQKTEQFENHDGERVALLTSFCNYNSVMNPEDDQANPRHWDIGILVSGQDIWGQSNGVKTYDTLGLARTGSMCHPDISCLAVEFGVWGALGNNYPTSGFSAAYTLAHELGHTLGMSHDGFNNECESHGFIMAATRGSRGQTEWSKCSAEKLFQSESLSCLYDRPHEKLKWDHNNTMGVPGHFIAADEQCKFYFHDSDKAKVENNQADVDYCKVLKCRNGDTVQETGPPLEGTRCGGDGSSWCKQGECVPIQAAQWSYARKNSCRSGCLAKSTGYQEVDRVCLILEGFEDQDCEGAQSWVELCDDAHLCGTRSCSATRRTRTQTAELACEKHAKFYSVLDESNPVGKPAKYSEDKPWQACSVYCQTKDESEWISPRGVFFPDGTWCHNDGTQDYFCRNHLCLASNYTDTQKHGNYDRRHL